MALSSIALVTVQQAKEFLKKRDDEDLAVMEAIVDGVSGAFNAATDRTLKSTEYTGLELDGTGRADLWLPNYPVTTLTSVVEDGATLVEGTDFYAYLTTGRLRRAASVIDGEPAAWTTKPKAVVVSLEAGYAEGSVPADMVLACLMQTAHLWQKFMTKSWAELSRSAGGQSVSISDQDLLPFVRSVLARYRRRTI